MRKVFLPVIIFILYSAIANAQQLAGNVKDANTKENLLYVNVGIIGKGIGTVTDDNGNFKLMLNNNSADSLKISMIGYYPQTFCVADISKNNIDLNNILLKPAVHQLAEVKVFGNKLKQSILGNQTKSQSTDAGFSDNSLGHEIGIIIKIKRSPTHIKQFNASLAHAPTDSVKLRLNFYSVKNGLPDKIIQQQNIFVTVKKGQQAISVDLTPYHIIVDDNFYVSLEWIQRSKGAGLMFSASLLSSAIISRETSQDKWEKIGLAGIGFNVLAEY
jgi:hypothetical protein